MTRLMPIRDRDHADEIVGTALRRSLDIEVNPCVRIGNGRTAVNENLRLSQCKGAERNMVYRRRFFRTFGFSPQSKCVRELVYCKNTLPIQLFNLNFVHPAQEAEIVIFDRLLVATIVEYTGLAVVIKYEHRRLKGLKQFCDL